MALSFRGILASWAVAVVVPVALAAQQPATITGRVTGEGGSGLAGVAVSIPELGLGGSTKDNGIYLFTGPRFRAKARDVGIDAAAKRAVAHRSS